MNRIVVLDEDGEIDVFCSEDVDDLHNCIESYPACIYFYADVELKLSPEILEPMDIVERIEVLPECTVVAFRNGVCICSHYEAEDSDANFFWDNVPSLRPLE